MRKNHLVLCIFIFVVTKIYAQTLTLNNTYSPGNTIYRYRGGYTFSGHIVIKPKVILELECGIYRFAKNAKITVEKGGMLSLNGATLTQTGDNTDGTSNSLSFTNNWSGIEVFGDECDDQEEVTCSTSPCTVPESPTNTTGLFDAYLYNQGVITMYNSKIRYSNFGVNLGKIIDNLQWQAEAGGGCDNPSTNYGGGILKASYSYFQNNRFRHIAFGYYRGYFNKSTIKNNEFSFNHLIGSWPTLTDMHTSICIDNNSFQYDIQENRFTVNTLFNNFKGISSNGYIRARLNTFSRYMLGIESQKPFNVFPFPNFNTISENFFDECQIGVMNAGTENLLVDANQFKSCTFSRLVNGGPSYLSYFSGNLSGYSVQDGTVGTYNSKGLNFKYINNTYTRKGSLSPQDANLVTYKSSNLASSFSKNKTVLALTSFRGIDDNKGFALTCNNFSSVFVDILNDGNGLLSNQGATLSPTGNIHSRRGGGNFYDIQNKNTTTYNINKLKYTHNVSTSQTPSSITGSTVQLNSTSSTRNCPTDYKISKYNTNCGANRKIDIVISQYNAIKTTISDIEQSGVTEEEQAEYEIALKEYDLTMTDQIANFASNAVEFGYNEYDSIKIFLIAHNTINSKFYLVQHYISNGHFTDADALMDSLAAQNPYNQLVSDFIEFTTISLEYAQNGYSKTWLVSNYNTIKTIADSSGYFSQAARNLVQYIADYDTTNAYHNSQMYYAYLPSTDFSLDSMGLTETENITVYPVPFENTLSTEIENLQGFNRTFVIKLKELTGYELLNSNLVVNSNDTNTLNETTSSINKGTYILQVFEGGTLIESHLIIK